MKLRTTPLPLRRPVAEVSQGDRSSECVGETTYSSIFSLLFLVTLLVCGGLLVVRLAVGLGESLPLVAKHLADLTCRVVRLGVPGRYGSDRDFD